jgi:hypothetical protein
MSDNSATMSPQECLAIDGAAEAPIYADSGYWAERDQSMNNGDNFTHYLKQAVVLLARIEVADAFFNDSAGRWPARREYTPHAKQVAVDRWAHHQRWRHAECHRD